MKKGIEKGIEKGKKEGRKEGRKEGVRKGLLIGEILMAQRILKQSLYSQAELEKKNLSELKKILAKLEASLPLS